MSKQQPAKSATKSKAPSNPKTSMPESSTPESLPARFRDPMFPDPKPSRPEELPIPKASKSRDKKADPSARIKRWPRPKLFTKEEVIVAIKACARKLDRIPSMEEVRQETGMRTVNIQQTFGTFAYALKTAGLVRAVGAPKLSMEELFKDWVEVAQAVNRIPTDGDYRLHGKFSMAPYINRYGLWTRVASGLREYAELNGVADKHANLMAMVAERERQSKPAKKGVVERGADGAPLTPKPMLRQDRPVYGPPLLLPGLAHEPVNEAGVVFLFGMVAVKLGFVVTRLQTEFPDCEAVREIQPGRWQRLRIEFEYESHNFVAHKHNPDACDMIVCWRHNWAECPANVEVVELESVVKKLALIYGGGNEIG